MALDKPACKFLEPLYTLNFSYGSGDTRVNLIGKCHQVIWIPFSNNINTFDCGEPALKFIYLIMHLKTKHDKELH